MLSTIVPSLALFADRKVKSIAKSGLELVPPFEDHVQWQHVENSGLAGGLLKSCPNVVIGVHTVSGGLLAFSFLLGWRKKNIVEKTGARLILFGAVSNLFDRFSQGTVTDMFRFPKAPGKFKTLVFNIADFMILLGMLLALFGRLFRRK